MHEPLIPPPEAVFRSRPLCLTEEEKAGQVVRMNKISLAIWGRGIRCSGVGVRTGLVAATDSPPLLPMLASSHPALNSTGVPVGDGLRLINAQLHAARRYLR